MSMSHRRLLRSLSLAAGLLLVLATAGGCKTCQCNIRSPLDRLGGDWRIDADRTAAQWLANSAAGIPSLPTDPDARAARLAHLTELAQNLQVRIDPVVATISYYAPGEPTTPIPYKVLRLTETGVAIELAEGPERIAEITLRHDGAIEHQFTGQPESLYVLVRAR